MENISYLIISNGILNSKVMPCDSMNFAPSLPGEKENDLNYLFHVYPNKKTYINCFINYNNAQEVEKSINFLLLHADNFSSLDVIANIFKNIDLHSVKTLSPNNQKIRVFSTDYLFENKNTYLNITFSLSVPCSNEDYEQSMASLRQHVKDKIKSIMSAVHEKMKLQLFTPSVSPSSIMNKMKKI